VRIVRVWSGLEATTSDLLPIVGPALKATNFVHAFGFSGPGFQLVPVMGLVVSDLILEGKTKLPIDELLPTRELPEPQLPSLCVLSSGLIEMFSLALKRIHIALSTPLP